MYTLVDYRIILGVLAALISIISYVPYIRDCIKKKTNPSLYTWIVWAVITLIAFLAQLSAGAGAGAWVLGVTVLIDVLIVSFAFRNTQSKLSVSDNLCFVLAILAIISWQATNNPIYAIIFVILADALGFVITFKKTYYRPFDETVSTYVLAAIKHIFAFFALSIFTLATYLYPSYLIIANILFVIMVLIRRKKLSCIL